MGNNVLKKRLVRGAAWMLVFRAVGLTAGVLTSVVLVRLLGTTDIGIYFLAISVVKSLSIAGQFGLGSIGVRRISEALVYGGFAEAGHVGRTIVRAGLVLAALVAVALYLLMPFFSAGLADNGGLESIAIPVALWLLSAIVTALAGQVFQGYHDLRSASLFSAATGSLVSAGIYFSFLAFDIPTSLSAVVWIAAACSTATMAAAIVRLQSGFGLVIDGKLPQTKPTPRAWGRVFSDALPFWMTTISLLVISETDVWIIAHFLSINDVALYGAALRLMMLFAILTEIIATVLQATVSELYVRKEIERAGRVLRIGALSVALPGAGLLLLYAVVPEFAMTKIFGEAYRNGAAILVVHACGGFAGLLLGLPGVALRMMDRERTVMKVTLVTAVFAVIAAVFGAKQYGSLGVAYAVATAVFLQKAVLWSIAKSQLGVRTDLLRLRREDVTALMSVFRSSLNNRYGVDR